MALNAGHFEGVNAMDVVLTEPAQDMEEVRGVQDVVTFVRMGDM